MAIITEHLQLNKQFVIIDSPVPFTLIANNGTDEVYRMAGAWQIDTHKLLPEKYQKQYPVFNLDLVYDDTNLGGQLVTVRESNIDIGEGISGVNGQDVKVTNFNDLLTNLNNAEKILKNDVTLDDFLNLLFSNKIIYCSVKLYDINQNSNYVELLILNDEVKIYLYENANTKNTIQFKNFYFIGSKNDVINSGVSGKCSYYNKVGTDIITAFILDLLYSSGNTTGILCPWNPISNIKSFSDIYYKK